MDLWGGGGGTIYIYIYVYEIRTKNNIAFRIWVLRIQSFGFIRFRGEIGLWTFQFLRKGSRLKARVYAFVLRL